MHEHGTAVPPMASTTDLIAQALARVPLVASTDGRCRVVYQLHPPCTGGGELGSLLVQSGRDAVTSWVATSTRMPVGFWREVTVRANRAGELQLKLLLQVPEDIVRGASDEAPFRPPEAAVAALERHDAWVAERPAFLRHVRQSAGAPVLSVCYQVALGRARPPKEAQCWALSGDLRLAVTCEAAGGASYLVSAETFSQVSLSTGAALYVRVRRWLGLRLDGSLEPAQGGGGAEAGETGGAAAAAAAGTPAPGGCEKEAALCAAAAIVREAEGVESGGVLVSGRDVNMFGAALFARTRHNVRIVTHCPCAHADAVANVERATAAARMSVRHCPKSRTASLLDGMRREQVPAPRVAVVTAGRRGVGEATCRALRQLPVRLLVYVACCEATASADLAALLGGECGFAVVAAERYDHFHSSSHVGAALLLLRRPACLLLPVGPACSGKSTTCAALAAALPPGSTSVVERDAIHGAARATGLSLSASRKVTWASAAEALKGAAARGQLAVFDSCNARVGGRAHYAAMLSPAMLTLLVFSPSCGEEEHRAELLERARRRSAHPTFPRDCDARAASALDATIDAMEWPRLGELDAVWIRCDPLRRSAGEFPFRSVLGLVFRSFFWLPGDAAGVAEVEGAGCGAGLVAPAAGCRATVQAWMAPGLDERLGVPRPRARGAEYVSAAEVVVSVTDDAAGRVVLRIEPVCESSEVSGLRRAAEPRVVGDTESHTDTVSQRSE